MPLTPEIWKNRFTVNTVTEGSQFDPVITQLANGNVLVVWSSNADVGVGSAAGSDVIGQILDPLGNPVGNEIRLNLSFAADDEARPAITALPNGGFVVAYQDRDANDKISLRLNEFNENGGHVSDSATISVGTGSDNTSYGQHNGLAIAAASDTSVLIAYRNSSIDTPWGSNGDKNGFFYKLYNPSTNSYSDEFALERGRNGHILNLEAIALADGRYAVVYNAANYSFGTLLIENNSFFLQILNSDGTKAGGRVPIIDNQISAMAENISVSELANGNILVNWTVFDDIPLTTHFRQFSADGEALGDAIEFNNGGFLSEVVALDDGGFIIFFYDLDEDSWRGQHYDSSGVVVGDEFTVATGGVGQFNPTLLADGRVMVTYTQDDDVKVQIIDTRDTVSPVGVTDSDYVVGCLTSALMGPNSVI